MAIRRTSVLVDVSEELYYSLVEPLKKTRSLSKLIVALLESYENNGVVRQQVDNAIDGVDKLSDDAILNVASSMRESLRNLGIVSDMLEASSLEGLSAVERAESAVEGFGGMDGEPKQWGIPTTAPLLPEELNAVPDKVSEMSKRMDRLEELVTKSFDSITGKIDALMSSGMSVKSTGEVKTMPVGDNRASDEVKVFDEIKVSDEMKVVDEKSTVSLSESSVEEVEDDDFLNDLMSGNVVNF